MSAEHVNVRAYNVGFGDCFLLTFPGADRPHRVLIDCGSMKAGKGGSIDEVVADVVKDVADGEGTPRIDVAVMSHRHRDHVSGFANDLWNKVEVDEVWMPWTENPDDPAARSVLKQQSSFAMALKHGLTGMRERKLLDRSSLAAIDLVAVNAMTNEEAMSTLHDGFANTPRKRFVSRDDLLIETDALPGVTVHVLGPDKSEEIVREMNPPRDESFFRAAVKPTAALSTGGLPFREYELSDEELDRLDDLRPDQDLVELLETLSDEVALFAAVALDKAVNNTSLMLLFEVGDAFLLFPGDSQWGTWDLNMSDPLTRSLMARTTFYKIGHHGSHNATPVTFVEQILGRRFWATASVTPHGRFKEIPKKELLEDLAQLNEDRDRVLRTDKPPKVGVDGVTVNGVRSIDIAVPI